AVLLVPEDVRAADEREVGKDPLVPDLRDLQPGLLPDALPRHARDAAAHLRLLAVRAPEGPPADEPDDDDLALRSGSGADHPGVQLLPLDAPRKDRRSEPVAGQHAGVADLFASSPRELHRSRVADGLPRALRVQRSGAGRRPLAAERAARSGFHGGGACLGRLLPAPGFIASRS